MFRSFIGRIGGGVWDTSAPPSPTTAARAVASTAASLAASTSTSTSSVSVAARLGSRSGAVVAWGRCCPCRGHVVGYSSMDQVVQVACQLARVVRAEENTNIDSVCTMQDTQRQIGCSGKSGGLIQLKMQGPMLDMVGLPGSF